MTLRKFKLVLLSLDFLIYKVEIIILVSVLLVLNETLCLKCVVQAYHIALNK